jgi:maleylpyruvate isomerase
MASPSERPIEDLRRVEDAERRFADLVADLDDGTVTAPCKLPGWTVGHLLTHVARNADSHTLRADAAARSEVVDQYPGGFEGRAAAIESGAARPAAEQLADLAASAERMTAAWAAVPESAWANLTRDVGGRERPLSALPGRRWQELEVHAVDLAFGPGPRDWSDDFVSVWLPRLRAEVPARVATGVDPEQVMAQAATLLDERDELAWLYGRLERPDLPELRPWS